MRSLLMLAAVVAAYGLLRGHPEGWPGVVRLCVAVLVLVAGLGAWGKRRTSGGAVAASWRGVGWLDYGAIGLAVLAAECLLLVFFSAAPPVLEAAAGRVMDGWRPAGEVGGPEDPGGRAAAGGNWLWDQERRRPLPLRTDFKPGNRPEVFLRPTGEADVEALLRGRIRVHAFALSRYADGAWQAFPGEGERIRAGADGWLRVSPERPGRAVEGRVFLGSDGSRQHPLTGLQGMVAARVPEAVKWDEGLHVLRGGEEGQEYDVRSLPVDLDEVGVARIPAGAPVEWLELPGGEMGDRLRELAGNVGGEGDLRERLTRIREHLRTDHGYSLVTENPEGRDPLENFLFHERRGHCEFFATAGALLARACGVPSRLCYGWAGGTFHEGSRLFVFRAREAHAWAEVWLEGYGWVVMDPTPPTGLPRTTTAAAGEELPELAELDAPEVEENGRELWWLGLGLALLFGLPGLGLLGFRAARRADHDGQPGTGRRRRGYAWAFRVGCGKRGLRVLPGHTLKGIVEGLEEKPEFAGELVAYHYGVSYEGRERDEKMEEELVRRVGAWER